MSLFPFLTCANITSRCCLVCTLRRTANMADEQTVDLEATIKVTKMTDRSIVMFILQHLIKPFNTTVIKPRQTFPPGSNRLTPDKNATKRCDISERKVEDIYIYDLAPKSTNTSQNARDTKSKRRLYYFCGGSWQMPPSSQHWSLCAEIACKLPDIIVSVVSYPLAPNSPAPMAFPQLMKMYKRVLEEAEEAGERTIFMGDSSGGNIILCLTMAALREDENARCPTALMAVSPSVDLREINPAMKEVEKHDPILRLAFCLDNANKWRGDWSADDPRVTPLLAYVSLLAERGVQVHGAVGRYDILSPDAILFREKCVKAGVKGEWLDWDKQMHCFPLAWTYGLPESVTAKDWILDVLRRG